MVRQGCVLIAFLSLYVQFHSHLKVSAMIVSGTTPLSGAGALETYSVEDASVSEDGGSVKIRLTRTKWDKAANVRFSITPRNVNVNSAVKPFTKNVVFEEGVRVVEITVQIADDKIFEDNEVFNLQISRPSTGRIKQGKATLTVLDDDTM